MHLCEAVAISFLCSKTFLGVFCNNFACIHNSTILHYAALQRRDLCLLPSAKPFPAYYLNNSQPCWCYANHNKILIFLFHQKKNSKVNGNCKSLTAVELNNFVEIKRQLRLRGYQCSDEQTIFFYSVPSSKY